MVDLCGLRLLSNLFDYLWGLGVTQDRDLYPLRTGLLLGTLSIILFLQASLSESKNSKIMVP